MMIQIEYFYLAITVMAVIGTYLSWTYGNNEYDYGFMDAVQLHSEGRLTYTVEEQEDGINLINIEVKE